MASLDQLGLDNIDLNFAAADAHPNNRHSSSMYWRAPSKKVEFPQSPPAGSSFVSSFLTDEPEKGEKSPFEPN